MPPSLVPRCRRHIFEEVELYGKAHLGSKFSYPRPNSSRIQAFLSLIEGAQSASLGPPIQDYVRVLRIDNNPSPLIFRITALLPNLECLFLKTSLSRYEERIALDYEANHRLIGGGSHDIEQLRTDCYDEVRPFARCTRFPLRLDSS